jgi:hypothetical protein
MTLGGIIFIPNGFRIIKFIEQYYNLGRGWHVKDSGMCGSP